MPGSDVRGGARNPSLWTASRIWAVRDHCRGTATPFGQGRLFPGRGHGSVVAGGELVVHLDDLVAEPLPVGGDFGQGVGLLLGVDHDVVGDVTARGQADADDHGAQSDDAAGPDDRVVHRRLEADEAVVADVAGAVHEAWCVRQTLRPTYMA